MNELLIRLTKLHSVFSNRLFQDITLEDIGNSLDFVLQANFCFCTPAGCILYTNTEKENFVFSAGQEDQSKQFFVSPQLL